MRMLLLAINFFLVLTLGNAIMYRHGMAFFHRQNYALLQVPHGIAVNFERDVAIWREFGAAALTIVIFGGAVYLRSSRFAAVRTGSTDKRRSMGA